MSGGVAVWTVRLAWCATVLCTGLAVTLAARNEVSSLGNTVFVGLLILTFSTVGALICVRRAGNAIGWLFLGGALAWALGELTLEYAVYALVSDPGSFPAGTWAAWFGAWTRGLGWGVIVTFLPLLFPGGRLPSRRWRPAAWLLVLYLAFFTLASWLAPVSTDLRLASFRNPLGFGGALPNLLIEALYLTLPFPIILSGVALAVRFRGSAGVERQQIKWFAYAVGVMVVVFAAWMFLALAGVVTASPLTYAVPMLGLPVAVGVAVLRHRLYDIDLVINLTLVYATLTAVLVGVYLGSVVVLQYAFETLTGGDSQLAVVASTLAIAALFNPLRHRIQAFVDRRFYRQKYDARQTLDKFGHTLRGELDLDALGNELLGVVRTTVRPVHASLWLREREEGR